MSKPSRMIAEEEVSRVLKPIRQLPPVNPRAPTLTKPGYYTVPPIKRLRRYSDAQLQASPSRPPMLAGIPHLQSANVRSQLAEHMSTCDSRK